MSQAVIIGAVIGLILVIAGVWRWSRGTRRHQLRRLAPSLGLERGDPQQARSSGLLEAAPFRDAGGEVLLSMRGRVLDADLLVCELGGSGPAPDPLALFDLQADPLPVFELRPRTDSTEATGLLFEGRERFGDLYRLRAEDEAAVRALFRDDVVGFFERAENESWILVSNGRWLGLGVAPIGVRRVRLPAKHLAGFVEDAKLVYRVLRGAPPRPRVGRES